MFTAKDMVLNKDYVCTNFLSSLIFDCKNLTDQLPQSRIQHTPREGNVVEFTFSSRFHLVVRFLLMLICTGSKYS